ncbi:hypothetical protein GMRT_10369 [Giardia muris]|uniref:Uncharacterized protein n=1 Tax=Giardia muris TaxID=5742 RepID=A0A4Z1SWG2_GIAMU|nr:hypothetical protein GMRT_10369 [Giardia muris]|eukprot:TNJ30076.1 hypothetical protein GMRT_10369 [Giardia muris]
MASSTTQVISEMKELTEMTEIRAPNTHMYTYDLEVGCFWLRPFADFDSNDDAWRLAIQLLYRLRGSFFLGYALSQTRLLLFIPRSNISSFQQLLQRQAPWLSLTTAYSEVQPPQFRVALYHSFLSKGVGDLLIITHGLIFKDGLQMKLNITETVRAELRTKKLRCYRIAYETETSCVSYLSLEDTSKDGNVLGTLFQAPSLERIEYKSMRINKDLNVSDRYLLSLRHGYPASEELCDVVLLSGKRLTLFRRALILIRIIPNRVLRRSKEFNYQIDTHLKHLQAPILPDQLLDITSLSVPQKMSDANISTNPSKSLTRELKASTKQELDVSEPIEEEIDTSSNSATSLDSMDSIVSITSTASDKTIWPKSKRIQKNSTPSIIASIVRRKEKDETGFQSARALLLDTQLSNIPNPLLKEIVLLLWKADHFLLENPLQTGLEDMNKALLKYQQEPDNYSVGTEMIFIHRYGKEKEGEKKTIIDEAHPHTSTVDTQLYLLELETWLNHLPKAESLQTYHLFVSHLAGKEALNAWSQIVVPLIQLRGGIIDITEDKHCDDQNDQASSSRPTASNTSILKEELPSLYGEPSLKQTSKDGIQTSIGITSEEASSSNTEGLTSLETKTTSTDDSIHLAKRTKKVRFFNVVQYVLGDNRSTHRWLNDNEVDYLPIPRRFLFSLLDQDEACQAASV